MEKIKTSRRNSEKRNIETGQNKEQILDDGRNIKLDPMQYKQIEHIIKQELFPDLRKSLTY